MLDQSSLRGFARERRRRSVPFSQAAHLPVGGRAEVVGDQDLHQLLLAEPPGALRRLDKEEQVHRQFRPDDGVDDALQVEALVDAAIRHDDHAAPPLYRVDNGLLPVLRLDIVGQRPGVKLLEHPLQAPGHAAHGVLLEVKHHSAAGLEFLAGGLDEPALDRVQVVPHEHRGLDDQLRLPLVAPVAPLGVVDPVGALAGQRREPAGNGSKGQSCGGIALSRQVLQRLHEARVGAGKVAFRNPLRHGGRLLTGLA